MKEIARFTENRKDQAFERFMQRVPGFEPDPPEAEIIQQELDKVQWKQGLAQSRKKEKGE